MTQAQQIVNPFEHVEIIDTATDFLKLKASASGETTKFVIIGPITSGFEYWTSDKKVVRQKTPWEKTPADCGTNDRGQVQPPRAFVAFCVYNITEDLFEVAAFSQRSVVQDLKNLGAEWGQSLINGTMAISIVGKKAGQRTTYTTMAVPPGVAIPEGAGAFVAEKNVETLMFPTTDGVTPEAMAAAEQVM